MPLRALAFDFNGTLSDDEHLLCAIFRDLFGELGRPLSDDEYYARLAGLSDPEIVQTWLGAGHPGIERVLAERARRYRLLAADGSTVSPAVREAVRLAAVAVPLVIVSGAARSEIEPVLDGAGISDCFRGIVAAEDVLRGKPDPEGYLRGLALLAPAAAGETLAFEDSEAGIAAALAAGLRCVAVSGTLPAERLRGAEALVHSLDAGLVRRLLEPGESDSAPPAQRGVQRDERPI